MEKKGWNAFPTQRNMRCLLIILLVLNAFLVHGQFESRKERDENKPQMFENEALISSVSIEFLETVFSLKLEQDVTLQITSKTKFKGIVVSVKESETYKVVSIQSTEISSASLIISKIKGQEDTHTRAVIFSKDYKDVLVLEHNLDVGRYVWHKKELCDLLPD